MVAAVGMVAVLISPVSWIHHWHWGIAVVGALLGDGRTYRRVFAAAGVLVVLLLPLPWWGGAWPGHGPMVSIAGRIVEQSYTLLAVVSLVLLWRLVLPSGSRHLEQAEQGERREQRAGRCADPADQGQGQPAQQRPTGHRGDT